MKMPADLSGEKTLALALPFLVEIDPVVIAKVKDYLCKSIGDDLLFLGRNILVFNDPVAFDSILSGFRRVDSLEFHGLCPPQYLRRREVKILILIRVLC